jgi:sugar (pentulose or hexulose) kinase
VLRAVVEGLAHELARNLLQLSRNGLSVRRLLLSGPAANSRVVAQIIANVANRPVLCLKETAMSALGATVLARSLVDRDADLPSLTSKVISEHRTLTPDADVSLYQQSFQEYRDWFKQHDREESAG